MRIPNLARIRAIVPVIAIVRGSRAFRATHTSLKVIGSVRGTLATLAFIASVVTGGLFATGTTHFAPRADIANALPVLAGPPRVTVDRQTVGYNDPFQFCFDGFGTISTQERVRFLYPDGTEQRIQYARTFDPPARCRQFAFESSSPWEPGLYTFDWLINGQPISFTITLAASSTSPTPRP